MAPSGPGSSGAKNATVTPLKGDSGEIPMGTRSRRVRDGRLTVTAAPQPAQLQALGTEESRALECPKSLRAAKRRIISYRVTED